MKQKLLLFLVSLMCSVGAWADDPTVSIETIAKDTTFTDVIRTYDEGVTLSSSVTTWSGNISGHSYIALGSNASAYDANYFSVAATKKISKVEFLIASNGDYTCTFALVGWKAGATSNAADYSTTKTTTSASKAWDDAHWESFDLSDQSLKEVRIYRKLSAGAITINKTENAQLGNGKTINILGVRVYVDAGTTPSITASNATIAATIAGTAATTAIDVTGSNLTGTTLSASLSPTVEGLSVSLDKTAISSGAITAVATLSYTSSINVKAGTTTLTITDGTTSKAVTITYSANVVDWELESISTATTWDFSKTSVASDADASLQADSGIKLTDSTTPTNVTEVVYANASYITLSDGFDGTSISFKGTYPTRNANMCQAGTLHFKTTVPGNVTVKFSDTGSKVSDTATPRYLIINGNQTVYWTSRPTSGSKNSNDTKEKTVPVDKGDVYITGSKDQCYYTVTFTPADVDKTITLGTNGYSTYCSDYAFTATGATAYKATYANNTVTLSAIEGVIPAGEGIILNGTEGASVTISPATTTAEEINSALTGVSSVTTALATTGTNYFLASNGTKTAFVPLSGVTLESMTNKAYLNVPEAGAKISIKFADDDTATCINEISTEDKADTAYNVAGQRVNANAKGIIIVNGKKYFNK